MFYKWRAKCGDMDALLMNRLRKLEDENRRFRRCPPKSALSLSRVQESSALPAYAMLRAFCGYAVIACVEFIFYKWARRADQLGISIDYCDRENHSKMLISKELAEPFGIIGSISTYLAL